MTFDCPCGNSVSLSEPEERLRYSSKVQSMEQSADRRRDFETFLQSAQGELSTPSFTSWAGGEERVTLALVFTDVVGSTALGELLKDDQMGNLRRAHFTQSRRLIAQHRGREVKTIGDSFLVAFRSVDRAIDYAMALQDHPGDPELKIRAGIHIGPVQVEENDVFGSSVNFAARVVGAIEVAEIWLSEPAKDSLDSNGSPKYQNLRWKRVVDVLMKGFANVFTLWSLER
jgi:class 3 adenylate cyclase